MGKKNKRVSMMGIIFIAILVLYPLRHITWGLDLWDTGYNYANFQYMGTEHMDPMWLFSTYLANAVGNFITKLPGADGLVGMNLYTGLFTSILALMGYFFCTKKLNMPKGIVFVGEMVAISLCWCPTALLYNYLTYVLFLGSVILLYYGLVEERKGFLLGAGVLLGANVLVRFSNLPQMGMIAAVWAYDVILWLEERKAQKSSNRGDAPAGQGKSRADRTAKFWPRILTHTLWCLLGYLAALAVLFGFIHIRYGLDAYFAGIQRLFAMTDNATDYKATSMIMGMVETYVENLYWVLRIGVIMAGGLLMFAVTGWMEERCRRRPGTVRLIRPIQISAKVLWALVSAAMLGWLYYREFCSFLFYSYDSMLRPGVLFLMLTMLIAAIRIFHKDSPKEEKLISGMLILIILLTSLGSNNKVYPSLNNLFVVAPYTLWESWRFVRRVGSRLIAVKRGKDGRVAVVTLDSFPLKGLLTAFLVLCLFQFGAFGAKFVFAEATGVQDVSATVENNEILAGMKMSPEKAQWMTELSAYVSENQLAGKEVILYGNVPALSYYLQMPSAFNPWSDLRSYSLATMKQDMAELEGLITEKGEEKPVIIVENTYALKQDAVEDDEKWKLLWEFMEEYGYEQAFCNEKFTVYR